MRNAGISNSALNEEESAQSLKRMKQKTKGLQMKSKAYVKRQNLPSAPAPTRPVRVESESESTCRMSLEFVTDDQRAKAIKSRNENLPNAWTYEELNQLKKMYRGGMSRQEIINHFPNRTSDAVACKLRKLIKKGEL